MLWIFKICYGFVTDLFNTHNNKLIMLNETYVFTSPSEDLKYMYFPEGLGLLGDSHYYLMKYFQPLHFGENGYEVTDIRIRGLSFLVLDLRRTYRLPRHQTQHLTPIYVIQKHYFINKSSDLEKERNIYLGLRK